MSANKQTGDINCRCGMQAAITYIVARVHVDTGATQVLRYLLGVTCSCGAQETVALVSLTKAHKRTLFNATFSHVKLFFDNDANSLSRILLALPI